MKRKHICYLAVGLLSLTAIFITGCSSEAPGLEESIKTEDKGEGLSGILDPKEAIEIAQGVMDGWHTTRSTSWDLKTQYLIDGNSICPDTLGYVVMPQDECGYVLVSRLNIANPVIAYSDSEQWNPTDGDLPEELALMLRAYQLSEEGTFREGTTATQVPAGQGILIAPKQILPLSQTYPFNKKVAELNSNAPAGCVPIATLGIMGTVDNAVTMNGKTYDLYEIYRSIYTHDTGREYPVRNPDPFAPSGPSPMMAYSEAVEQVAELVWQIGLAEHIEFGSTESAGNARDAYSLLSTMGYYIPSGYKAYDIYSIKDYLLRGYMIFMRGVAYKERKGHAWLVDGMHYSTAHEVKEGTYLHCHWGWEGRFDGYYNGNVFSAGAYDLTPTNYFAVKAYNDEEWEDEE